MFIAEITATYKQGSKFSGTGGYITSRVEETYTVTESLEAALNSVKYIKWAVKQTDCHVSIRDYDAPYGSNSLCTIGLEFRDGVKCLIYRDWDNGKLTSDVGRVITWAEFQRYYFCILDSIKIDRQNAA